MLYEDHNNNNNKHHSFTWVSSSAPHSKISEELIVFGHRPELLNVDPGRIRSKLLIHNSHSSNFKPTCNYMQIHTDRKEKYIKMENCRTAVEAKGSSTRDYSETTQNTVTWAALDQSVVIAVCLLYLSALVCVALLVGGWVFFFFFSFYGSLVDL
jgi:hypothetical protein